MGHTGTWRTPRCSPHSRWLSSPLPMASEEPTTPPAPAAPGRKRRRKGKEKPILGEGDNAEDGDDGAGRVAEIEGLTRAGCRALGLGDTRGALGCFRRAVGLSLRTPTPRLRRDCAFRLGAAYVEAGKPRKGLKFLLKSQPSDGERPEGLRFDVAAAHEGLRDFPEDLRGSGGAAPRAGSSAVMGCCYLGMREPDRAARCFLEAARGYAGIHRPEAAAVALSRASGSMLRSGRFGAAEVAGTLAQCRALCDSIPDPTLQGKLYNDIGLGYSQLRIFPLAAESFERALTACRGAPGCSGEAAVLQNLGAARNALRRFNAALAPHRRAAALHGAAGNRRAQGQCFGNLAYAFSQLGEHEAAAENYLHALQAFRDSGDVHGQCKACEGLGAARFHLGDPQRAVGHYQEALRLLSRCQGTPRADGERIVTELTRTLQLQLCLRPTPALDLVPLQFCSPLPHISGTQLRGRTVSFRDTARGGGEAAQGDPPRGSAPKLRHPPALPPSIPAVIALRAAPEPPRSTRAGPGGRGGCTVLSQLCSLL
ncbi:tetratricopeptide repeat protein 24 [Gallus gallus]|uniref:tetratricopeptide repeat protein 24 n=1 Tax=Gallus gallus TaxID=9031 RepID=UPI001AE6AAA2|nr:tetratricopeptide repeat protein 24 [Gallus gallus]